MDVSNFIGQGHLTNSGRASPVAIPAWSSILSSTRISCSTVLMAPDGQSPLQSHMFLNVFIDNFFLCKRSNIHSILIGTLLAFLRDRIPTECGISRDLANIINGGRPALELVTIATSRVPSFRDDIQNPVNGYRSLGALLSIHVAKEIPSQATVELNRELLAVDAGDRTITSDFLRTWAPFGLTTETHFIIIFTDSSIPTPNISRNGSPFSHRGLGINTASASASRRSSIQPSPLIGTVIGGDSGLRGLDDVPSNTSRTGSPALGTITNQHLPGSPASYQSLHTLQSQDMSEAQLVPGTSIEAVCRCRGIAEEVFRAAKYNVNEKTLLGMVLNHRRMLEVMVGLGLQDRYGIFVSTRTHVYAGGLQLSAGGAVTACGWSVDSYKHKTVWFGWAEDAASRRWAGSVPTEGVNLQRYRYWQGIKYIWAPGGPLELGHFPENISVSSEGQAALELKQSNVSTHRTAIQACLEDLATAP